MFHKRHNSTLLDLEAANYFELDPSQFHLLNITSSQTNLSEELSPKDRFSIVSNASTNTKSQMRDQSNSMRSRQKPSTHHANYRPPKEHSKITKTQCNESANKRPKRTHKINQMDLPSTSNLAVAYTRGRSPSSSTCSLPSISSSPSLSPSLVCPHLSIDDILTRHNDGRNRSAHTIGLCEECLVCPPPDIHSPLSPAFRPSASRLQAGQLSSSSAHLSRVEKPPVGKMALKRGYSDQQVRRRRTSRNERLGIAHDDSLDYYLEPDDLKLLQMSPTIRHSVEYIRNNTTEAGRVVRIYKNGRPFDKPLRICIMRGEFSNLNHLLDHINSRQLIPSGARYLFHLDGQLVYSENELKHGSCYIVSGTRSFDYKVNSILKERNQHVKVDGKQASHVPKVYLHEGRSRLSHQISAKDPSIQESALNKVAQSRNSSTKRGVSKKDDVSINNCTAREMAGQIDDIQLKVGRNKSDLAPTRTTKLVQRPSASNKVASAKQVKPSPTSSTASRVINGKRFSAKEQAQDTTIRSNENLIDGALENEAERQQNSLVRARSELSALPRNKRKKNVTFVDTGRGSSPAINLAEPEIERDDHENKPDNTISKELETNDIGIQVSDSIEGYLIDLPIVLPTDKHTGDRKGEPAARKAPNSQIRNQNKSSPVRRKHGKVITITERQLSFDEMGKLKDMHAGDHHNETHKIQHVSITLDSVADDHEAVKDTIEEQHKEAEVIVPDLGDDTISIGQEPGGKESGSNKSDGQPIRDQWQYPSEPGGKSATPTERPVSQSEANEAVHARVTTPTPSLSTMGDNNSLAMSYDYCQYQHDGEASAVAVANLPDKHRLPVMGTLRHGLNPPGKNFKLVWVNGFIINDQYPENSSTAASVISNGSRSADMKSPVTGLLSPADAEQRSSPNNQFKPSDRFHNWVCHSRRHDELVYPAGSLVILWCRWTNEQRYYSGHTSNVSAITLASLDDDLAASAQVGDPRDRTNNASIHLWCLSSLETLRVVDDDNFRNKHIYSLKVRNTQLDGCELSISCREDNKRLWLYVLFLKLSQRARSNSMDSSSKVKQLTASPQRGGQITIKSNKPLQANQIPLLLARLSNAREEQFPKSTTTTTTAPSKKLSTATKDIFGNLMVSFGRRHFQVWFVDRKSQSLTPIQALNKSSYFVETIVRANCLARMSPSEFLIGDSTGNLGFLIIRLHQSKDTMALIGSPSRVASGNLKYSVETWPLIDSAKKGGLNAEPTSLSPITCLSRISGSLFAAADSNCVIKFWKIIRSASMHDYREPVKEDAIADSSKSNKLDIKCQQVGCIRLPRDLGFICSIILSKYSRKQPITVEFYVLSTSNAILFGLVQLQASEETSNVTQMMQDRAPLSCSLSVIHEGHEIPAMSLVADPLQPSSTSKAGHKETTSEISDQQIGDYFTCSLDCKICKWSGKNLVWKSMLPSSCASLAVHPVGFVLAVGSTDGTVYVLDKISGLLISYFPLTPVCINCLAYSRDGTLLAAGCANGSIFILPVYERGLKYKKVSILQSPYPVVSLQFSVNNKYILTSVTHGSYQELILWDLPNFRYMRNNVKMMADKIEWFDSICSGSEDVRAIWENANLDSTTNELNTNSSTARTKYQARRLSLSSSDPIQTKTIVNLSCHRLIRNKQPAGDDINVENFVIASDTRGYLRLFHYPCSDIQQGFYQIRVSSSPVSCCRFLAIRDSGKIEGAMFVSSSLDGSICLWSFC